MHRIFSGDGWLVVLGIRVASGQAFEFEPAFAEIVEQSHLKSARDGRRSHCLVQQPPVLIILCILCIDVEWMVLLDGSATSRGAGGRYPRKVSPASLCGGGLVNRKLARYPTSRLTAMLSTGIHIQLMGSWETVTAPTSFSRM